MAIGVVARLNPFSSPSINVRQSVFSIVVVFSPLDTIGRPLYRYRCSGHLSTVSVFSLCPFSRCAYDFFSVAPVFFFCVLSMRTSTQPTFRFFRLFLSFHIWIFERPFVRFCIQFADPVPFAADHSQTFSMLSLRSFSRCDAPFTARVANITYLFAIVFNLTILSSLLIFWLKVIAASSTVCWTKSLGLIENALLDSIKLKTI